MGLFLKGDGAVSADVLLALPLGDSGLGLLSKSDPTGIIFLRPDGVSCNNDFRAEMAEPVPRTGSKVPYLEPVTKLEPWFRIFGTMVPQY